MQNERIERAKWLLDNIKHAAMATVSSDGTPHNTPYLFMRSGDLSELYWSSNPKSLHSQNIARTGNIFVVLYEADAGGGLYIKCENGRVAKNMELERALKVHNTIRAKHNLGPLRPEYYLEPSGQRMYVADTVSFWVNYAEKYDSGDIREDKRMPINRKDLLI